MSLETVSTKRNRVYQRKFDHEDAQARVAAGESVTALAREYGVTFQAVKRIVDEDVRERMQAQTDRWVMRGECVDCGRKGISRHRARCAECSATERRTTVRPDTLRCHTCLQWKPDADFPRNKSLGGRRGRHRQCSPCATIARRDYRNRNKVPCQGGCGRMVEGKGRADSRSATFLGRDIGRVRLDPDRPYYCRECSNQLPRGEHVVGIDTRFYILVETEPGVWTEQARIAAASRDDAIQQAFPNGNVPEERVCVISGVAFKPGRLVPVQRYALQTEDAGA